MILNYNPWLVNEAPAETQYAGCWTPHEYHHSAMITLGDVTEIQVTGIAHYFKCSVTGAIRR